MHSSLFIMFIYDCHRAKYTVISTLNAVKPDFNSALCLSKLFSLIYVNK